MIVPLLAVFAIQAEPAPDAASAALDLSRQCLAVMKGQAEPPAVAVRRVPLSNGLQGSIRITPGGCSLEIDDWRDDSGAFAGQVRDGLLAQHGHWRVTQWRERRVNESGPTLWTSIVFPDARRHSAYWVQIIEPEQGAPAHLSVSFGIGP